jgi:hypothetical protein
MGRPPAVKPKVKRRLVEDNGRSLGLSSDCMMHIVIAAGISRFQSTPILISRAPAAFPAIDKIGAGQAEICMLPRLSILSQQGSIVAGHCRASLLSVSAIHAARAIAYVGGTMYLICLLFPRAQTRACGQPKPNSTPWSSLAGLGN